MSRSLARAMVLGLLALQPGAQALQPSSDLPAITEAVVIDGQGSTSIRIDGSPAREAEDMADVKPWNRIEWAGLK